MRPFQVLKYQLGTLILDTLDSANESSFSDVYHLNEPNLDNNGYISAYC